MGWDWGGGVCEEVVSLNICGGGRRVGLVFIVVVVVVALVVALVVAVYVADT